MTELPGPDGIYGPPKPDFSKKDSGLGAGLIVAAAFCLAFAVAGFFGGRATAPQKSYHDIAVDMAQSKHCVPVLDWGVGNSEQEVLAANSTALPVLKEQGMTNIEASIVPITIGEKTYYLGILTWENCADG